MRKLVLLVLMMVAVALPASAAPSFTRVVGFPTKTGFRAVVAWEASEPIAGYVKWGTSSAALVNEVLPVAGVVDTGGMVVFDHGNAGSTIYYRVVDRISGVQSAVRSFTAENAYSAVAAGVATINLLVVLDSASLPDVIPVDQGLNDLAAGVNILAERVYDALDGYARIGKVLVTDTVLNRPVNVPARGLCTAVTGSTIGTAADFLVQTTVPFDSHTWTPWMIDSKCTGIYLGRLGWLVVPWDIDLDLGITMAHELMHYAFNSLDLYDVATGEGCNVPQYDISLMDNSSGYTGERWMYTELDRPSTATCPGVAAANSSWTRLRARYTNVPADNTPANVVDTAARGNPDGGALSISILRHLPGQTTLTSYTPVA